MRIFARPDRSVLSGCMRWPPAWRPSVWATEADSTKPTGGGGGGGGGEGGRADEKAGTISARPTSRIDRRQADRPAGRNGIAPTRQRLGSPDSKRVRSRWQPPRDRPASETVARRGPRPIVRQHGSPCARRKIRERPHAPADGQRVGFTRAQCRRRARRESVQMPLLPKP